MILRQIILIYFILIHFNLIFYLRRRGFTHEQIDTIHQVYRTIYQSGLNTSMAIERIKEEMEMTPEVEYIVSFVEGAKRGIIRYVD